LHSARGKAIDAIVTHFIRRLNIPNSELLLTDRPKLKFILGKIAQGNPYLLKVDCDPLSYSTPGSRV
jgi:hypothetical protein